MAGTRQSESSLEGLKKRNRELSVLGSIAAALNREVDLTQAIGTTLAQVAELLNLQTGWAWILRDDTGESYLAAAQNLPRGLAQNPERMEGTCYCLETYRRGDLRGAANVNSVTCSRLKALEGGTDGLRFHVSIPLYARKDKKLGVMNLASPDWRELSDDDLRLLYTIGDLLAIAIERARLFDQSSELGALDERNRLAREIHDTLAQGLAAIALQLETAEARLDAKSDLESVRVAVHQALSLTQENIDEARRSVLDLRAAPLQGRTLAEALAMLVEEMSEDGALKIKLELVGRARPLPSRIETALYRTAREALNNVDSHSEASNVIVRLVTTPRQVELSVEDDGIGFEPSETSKEHFGLVGMNERVKLLDGTMTLSTGEEVGTRIESRVPLSSSSQPASGA